MLETIGWISIIAVAGTLLFNGLKLIYIKCDRDLIVSSFISIIILVFFMLLGTLLFIVGEGVNEIATSGEKQKVITMYSKDGKPACSWSTTNPITDSEDSVKFMTDDNIEITVKDAPVVIKELK